MRIKIILPIKKPNDVLIDVAQIYLSKLPKNIDSDLVFCELKKKSDNEKERKQREGNELLRASEGFYRIALDEKGRHVSSDEFAKYIDKLRLRTKRAAFLIGGSTGLDKNVIENAQETISLSKLTLPHRCAALVLAEQIYRAFEIMKNSPYHK